MKANAFIEDAEQQLCVGNNGDVVATTTSPYTSDTCPSSSNSN